MRACRPRFRCINLGSCTFLNARNENERQRCRQLSASYNQSARNVLGCLGKMSYCNTKIGIYNKSVLVRVPTRTGKPGKMGRHFPVREKSGNFEQTGKVRESHTKYWKTEGISEKNYLLFFNDI